MAVNYVVIVNSYSSGTHPIISKKYYITFIKQVDRFTFYELQNSIYRDLMISRFLTDLIETISKVVNDE